MIMLPSSCPFFCIWRCICMSMSKVQIRSFCSRLFVFLLWFSNNTNQPLVLIKSYVRFLDLFFFLLASIWRAPTLQISQEKRGWHCCGSLAFRAEKQPRKYHWKSTYMKFMSFLRLVYFDHTAVTINGVRSIKQLLRYFFCIRMFIYFLEIC